MKINLIAALATTAVLCVTSCGKDTSERATEAAENFMKAFCAMDYEAAGSFCTGNMASLLTESTREMEEIPQPIMEKMKEASAETSFRIVSVTVNEEGTEAAVELLIKAPGLEKEVPKSIRLIFEGRTALVDAIQ